MKIEGRWNTVAVGILTVLRVALGALFIISAFAKLQHPDLFIDAVENYHMVPFGLADVFGTVLPWVELFIGWCLALGVFPTFAAVICILMTLAFVVANVTAIYFKDVGEACSCLGNLVNMSHTTSLVVDILMLTVAGLLVYQRRRAGVVAIGHLLKWERLRLPRIAIVGLGLLMVAIAMTVTFFMLPEEAAPWKESIDAELKNDKVVVVLLWKGESSEISDELRMFMELRDRYGESAEFIPIDAGEWDDAAAKLDVNDFPTLLIIEGKNNKGYILYPERFAGAEDRDALVAAIDEILVG